MQHLFDIFASWIPMLLLIGVWIFFMRRMGNTRQIRDEWMSWLKTYCTEHIVELRRQNATLERIATILEKSQPGAPHGQA